MHLYINFQKDDIWLKYIDKEIIEFYEKNLIENWLLEKLERSNPYWYDYKIKQIIKEKLKQNKEVNNNIF